MFEPFVLADGFKSKGVSVQIPVELVIVVRITDVLIIR